MPPESDGLYLQIHDGLTITARTRPDDDRRAHLCLAGEIDIASSAVLSKTVDWLTALAPVSVLIDLSGLTFAGATLPNFVARVRRAVPDGAELILCRPRTAIVRLLRITDMATIATIRDEATEPPSASA